MKRTLSACAWVAALGLAACNPKPIEPLPLPPVPAVKTFTASATRVSAGEEVTLSFEAENATKVTLMDQTGADIPLSGDAHGGSATVKPTASSFYVLRASAEGGRDTAFVQVAVDEDLQEVFLVAVPPEVTAGQPSTLLWSAFNAKTAAIQVPGSTDIPLDVTSGTGTVEVTPERTQAYQLSAQGAQGELAQAAEVKVHPLLKDFAVNPPAANPTETMTFDWTTAGATEVTLTEATFGELKKAAFPGEATEVDHGTFAWTVPEALPSTQPMVVGQPLHFTLTVKTANPAVTLTRQYDTFVGTGPQVLEFKAPAAVTEQHTFQLSWRTANAERVQIFADGGLIYEPLATSTGEIAKGSITLQAPKADTTFSIRAIGLTGVEAVQQQQVRVVVPPQVTAFTIPSPVVMAGIPATAAWTTTGATSVMLRVKNGPALFFTDTAAQVASGSADVYPGMATTFTLVATNDAGDQDVKDVLVDVSAPGILTASPAPVTSGELVTVSWDLDPSITAQLIGDLTQQPIRNNPGVGALDLETHIDAKELSFVDENDDAQPVPLTAPFSFPYAGETWTTFFVSTNGFVAPANFGGQPNNVPLNGADAPKVIAPFWDDLAVGPNSKLLWVVDGTTFPRRLIIQWDKFQMAGDPTSELTFQVQLYATGEIRYEYLNLSGSYTAGENASIGWRLNSSLSTELAQAGAASVATGDEIIFGAASPTTGSYSVTPERPSVFTLFGRLQTGEYVIYPARVNVFTPGAVLLNEVMVTPDPTALYGRWVEFFNTTEEPIDLSTATLRDEISMTDWVIPEGTILPAGGFLVAGESVDPLENGGAAVDVAWTGLTVDGAQDGTLTLLANSPVSTFSWATADVTAGTSLQVPEKAITNTGGPLTCARTKTFGSNGAVGTPGAENETCFEYRMTKIPVKFKDISGTAQPIFSASVDDSTTQINVSSAPFTYFGTPTNTISVSSNGWIAAYSETTSNLSNKTQPSTSSPKGSIALFWDDLRDVSGQGRVYVQHLAANEDFSEPRPHWVVLYKNWSRYGSSPADDLNMEAKLFDDGTIEFHYATMLSGNASNYATGNNATEWIERPDGTAALAIGINQAVITSNVAYRFTPKP